MARRSLTAAMSIALLVHLGVDSANDATARSGAPDLPQIPQNWPVQTCDDTAVSGSLRYIAQHANSGDTIDFSQLPAACGMADSTITLTAGEIILHQPYITLIGPAAGQGTVTISGGGQSRVLRHQVYSPFQGELQIEDLRIVDGHAYDTASIGGGCVYSDANIYLQRSLVDGCTAYSSAGSASGGGLWAAHGGFIAIASSKVSGNTAKVGSNGSAHGGGLSSVGLVSKYSQISGNSSAGGISGVGEGGGAFAITVSIAHSTVADNAASTWGGGVYVGGDTYLKVSNSTFSGNHASYRGGAILARPDSLFLYNATIASNSTDGQDSGGIYFNGTTVDMESTIVAGNTSSGMASGSDFYLAGGTLTGAHNGVMSSNVSAPGVITLTEDPRLAPLSWTGGPTRTMMLMPGSPAIGIGSNPKNWPTDQRGAGFPRATGPMATVDIGAVQFDDKVFVSDFDRFFF